MKTTGLYPRAACRCRAGARGRASGRSAADRDGPRHRSGPSSCRERLRRGGSRSRGHDPGKILTDLALMFALGGDCLADVATLRAEPEVYGPVASDPTISRLLTTLAG